MYLFFDKFMKRHQLFNIESINLGKYELIIF